jgi:hypothetical protein
MSVYTRDCRNLIVEGSLGWIDPLDYARSTSQETSQGPRLRRFLERPALITLASQHNASISTRRLQCLVQHPPRAMHLFFLNDQVCPDIISLYIAPNGFPEDVSPQRIPYLRSDSCRSLPCSWDAEALTSYGTSQPDDLPIAKQLLPVPSPCCFPALRRDTSRQAPRGRASYEASQTTRLHELSYTACHHAKT